MAAGGADQLTKKAWFHVDMDGLDAIFRGHGLSYDGATDRFYTSAVENSLAFFEEQRVRATYFVIAGDLDNAEKRAAIASVAKAGHHVACHGHRHLYLNRVTTAEKRDEIFTGKKKIEDALGVTCTGFRAPGYMIDFEAIALLGEAGFRYDSSIFPNADFRKRLEMSHIPLEPFEILPESGLLELPMPVLASFLPPFHPCYSLFLSRAYFKVCLNAFRKRRNHLQLLFHLTDFADQLPLPGGLKMSIYTANVFSRQAKMDFMRDAVSGVRKYFSLTTSEEFVAGWKHAVAVRQSPAALRTAQV